MAGPDPSPAEEKATGEIRIRYASAADDGLLSKLGAETFRDAFAVDNRREDMQAYLSQAFTPQKQASELADPSTVFLLAEIAGSAVGYARLKRGPRPGSTSGTRPIEIVRFYSHREWIGRGVGPALMRACLAEAAKQGCDTVWLDVWERNPRAIAFYRKYGFQVVGSQPYRLGSDLQNDLLMERPVAAD